MERVTPKGKLRRAGRATKREDPKRRGREGKRNAKMPETVCKASSEKEGAKEAEAERDFTVRETKTPTEERR